MMLDVSSEIIRGVTEGKARAGDCESGLAVEIVRVLCQHLACSTARRSFAAWTRLTETCVDTGAACSSR